MPGEEGGKPNLDAIGETIDPKAPIERGPQEEQHDLDKARVDRYRQETEQQKQYAERIFKLLKWWMFGVFVLVLLSSIKCGSFSCFALSDKVLITLLTTTTINIIGLAYVVVKRIFRNDGAAT